MQTLIRIFVAFGALAIFTAVSFTSAEDTAPPQPPVAKPKVTISKETTFITRPLRPDGYPDYVAAMNELLSKGVTPENNALVLLVKAMGTGDLKPELRAEFFKKLGIADLPEKGDYFVDESEMTRRWIAGRPPGAPAIDENALEEQFELSITRPWTAMEFPIVAEWLSVNEAPLKVVAEGVSRPKYFLPIVGKEGEQCPLWEGFSFITMNSREVVRALEARSMKRLHEGNTLAAWSDLLLAFRLVRHIGNEPYLVGSLVTMALEMQLIQATCSFLHYARPTSEQRAALSADLRALPHSQKFVDAIEPSERFFILDAVCFAARKGPDKLALFMDGNIFVPENDKLPEALREACKQAEIDWNAVLKQINLWQDRQLRLCKIADAAERSKAFKQFEDDLAEIKSTTVMAALSKPKEASAETLGIQLANLIACTSYPVLSRIDFIETRRTMLPELVQLFGALASYRADKGRYPEKLDDLVPKYLAALPKDRFAADERSVNYRREDNGYVVWSVHTNGIDDGGNNFDDEPLGDDWSFRPVPKAKAEN